MSDPEYDPSVDAEPHLKKHTFTPDPSEVRADQQLAREHSVTEPSVERAAHSVFDEPAVLPHRPPVRIDEDWYCRNCGYNLRGLMTGHPCPECGKVERYEPPREGEESYGKLLAQYQSQASLRNTWILVFTLPLLGIPLAAMCSLVSVEYAGVYSFVVLGPLLSEIAKVLACVMLIERGRYAMQDATPIWVLTLGTALVYAATQNALFLTWYYPGSPKELIAWRWTLCILVHGICTAIAARGLVQVWQPSQQDHRPVRLTVSFPSMIIAILLHASYNAVVFMGGYFGYGI